ncbi:hypothetical protein GCM10023205_09880 [Yinghuangia aomiensis]|uniref:NodB homology domain-containing protein n=1 Tax=Yinghuangia aomiensis TaxID=676205 RepID=A0ABP9GV73_9ACTN
MPLVREARAARGKRVRNTVAAAAVLALTAAGCASGGAGQTHAGHGSRPATPNAPGPQAAPDPHLGRGGPDPTAPGGGPSAGASAAPTPRTTAPQAPAPRTSASPSPSTQAPAPRTTSPSQAPVSQGVVRHTAEAGRNVALTFDDGPSPVWTPKVLALLDQYDVKATFCIVGEQAREYPNLVRRIVAKGHRLCDHTETHDEKLARLPAADVRREIGSARDAILAAVPGAEIPWFRAPGGGWSTTIKQTAASYGMKPLDWSVDSRDWERGGVDHILATIKSELRPGGVVLMHDAGGDRSQSVAVLARLLPWLVNQGYSFDFPA